MRNLIHAWAWTTCRRNCQNEVVSRNPRALTKMFVMHGSHGVGRFIRPLRDMRTIAAELGLA